MVDASDEALARVGSRVGLIVLNRPEAINSLTGSMVKTIQATLWGCEREDDVSARSAMLMWMRSSRRPGDELTFDEDEICADV
jgi:hypothetical protein